MKNALIITSIIGVIVVSGSFAYYLLAVVPQMQDKQLKAQAAQNSEQIRVKDQENKLKCEAAEPKKVDASNPFMIPTYKDC